jgi:uncharacterized protein
MSAHLKLEERLRSIIHADAEFMAFLTTARNLGLPQWRLVAGSIYQTVWNKLIGKPPRTGIKDWDLVYFDDSDLSWDAEDLVIQRAEAVFAGRWPVEVRNQARVHLWFQRRFGSPYPKLGSADESLCYYASVVQAVGVRLEANGQIDIAAPFGLEDLFGMVIRPNPRRDIDVGLAAKAALAKAIWPDLRVLL